MQYFYILVKHTAPSVLIHSVEGQKRDGDCNFPKFNPIKMFGMYIICYEHISKQALTFDQWDKKLNPPSLVWMLKGYTCSFLEVWPKYIVYIHDIDSFGLY